MTSHVIFVVQALEALSMEGIANTSREWHDDPDFALEALNFSELCNKIDGSECTEKCLSEGDAGHLDKRRALLQCPFATKDIRLVIQSNSFRSSDDTARLLRAVGGPPAILRMTTRFYAKFFANAHLSLFIADETEPHAHRLADWIVEKMGGGTPWTEERVERSRHPQPVLLANGTRHIVHDRSSAHVAAWYCAKRPAEKVGDHFMLHDARVWMRLHFWAAREVGLLELPAFKQWYLRFIAHFVRVYERLAVRFVRESCRWSESQENIDRYIESGNYMADCYDGDGEGLELEVAEQALPLEERNDLAWPY